LLVDFIPTQKGVSMDIFVFGSNREGRHGKGAALYAREKQGAIYGQAEGLQGKSYGIVTKELRPSFPPVTIEEVAEGVEKLLTFAKTHPEHTFIVSAIGCGLAGFTPAQIGPLFKNTPDNVHLPECFK
jgi:hypothetical protein